MDHLELLTEQCETTHPRPVGPGEPAPVRRPAARQPLLWLLLVIVLVAAALRFHGISQKSFWLDEGFSFTVARLGWAQLLHAVALRESNMALYFILLHVWLVLGKSETAIRSLSALFSLATVPVLYDLGKRLLGRPTGLVAAWLLAINAFHVRFAQEARGYALVAFFATLATWLLVRNMQEPSRARWGWYVAVCACTVYSHLYGGLVILAHGVAFLAPRNRPIAWRRVFVFLTAAGALSIPAVLFVVLRGPELSWLTPVTLDGLRSFGVEIAGNYGRILLALDALLVGVAALRMRRAWSGSQNPRQAWGNLLLFAWLLLPIGIVIAVSVVKPVFLPRYLTPCLPALLLLVAAGIVQLRPAALGWLLGLAVSVCSLLGTAAYYQRDFDVPHEDWRGAATYVLGHAQPGDSVFFYPPYAVAPFALYEAQRKVPPATPKLLNVDVAPPAQDTNQALTIPGTDLFSAKPEGQRVWVIFLTVYSPSGKPDLAKLAVRDWFSSGRHRAAVLRLYPIDIVLFARDGSESR